MSPMPRHRTRPCSCGLACTHVKLWRDAVHKTARRTVVRFRFRRAGKHAAGRLQRNRPPPITNATARRRGLQVSRLLDKTVLPRPLQRAEIEVAALRAETLRQLLQLLATEIDHRRCREGAHPLERLVDERHRRLFRRQWCEVAREPTQSQLLSVSEGSPAAGAAPPAGEARGGEGVRPVLCGSCSF